MKLPNFEDWSNGELSKSTKIWLWKSIFYVKNRPNRSNFVPALENSTTRITTVEEGSGNAVYQSLSPTEIGELRTSFYEANEVDLLRLDTTCQDRFISAPQIFHAKIR